MKFDILLVVAALGIAAQAVSSKQFGSHLRRGSGDLDALFDPVDADAVIERKSISFHPERSIHSKNSFIETKGNDLKLLSVDTWSDKINSIFYVDDEGIEENEASTERMIDILNNYQHQHNETRILADTNEDKYPRPDPLMSLPCNEGVAFDCTQTPLSSLPIPADGPLVIECGTCVYVDITDGQKLDLPNGLRIEGKLYFPSESNLKIYTTFIMVLGILKMDYPHVGNEVKISLHNVEDSEGKPIDHYFVADPQQQDSRSGKCLPDAAKACKVGKKVIAVVGGQLDIQGFDSSLSCPSWEQMLDFSVASTEKPSASPTVDPGSVCGGNLVGNGDFEDEDDPFNIWGGYKSRTFVYEDPLIPGNTAAQVKNRGGNNGFGMVQRLPDDGHHCFTDTEHKWKFEFDTRLLDEETKEGVDCDPTKNCPYVTFKGKDRVTDNSLWSSYKDEDMEWNKNAWNQFSVVFDTPENWLDMSRLDVYAIGGPPNTIIVVDNVRFERFYETPGSSESIESFDEGERFNQIHLSQQAAECWTPGSEILITSNEINWKGHQVATIESTNPSLGIIKLTSGIEPVSTVASDPKHAVEVALLNRRIVFEAEDDKDDDLHGGHLIVFATPDVAQHIEGVEIRNFGQQGVLGRYPIHFHICEHVTGSIVKKNVVRQSNQRCYVMHGTHDVKIEENISFDTSGHCFMTEDGGEHSNQFLRNLGVATKDVKDEKRLLDDFSKREENDDRSATFWMTNMENVYEGNVAAGSESFGYWAETHASLKNRAPGSIYQRPDHEPMFTGFGGKGSFKDNTAHSFGSVGFTQYPPGWLPPEPTVIENFRAFRGRKHAILLHNVKNLVFSGGYTAQIEHDHVILFGADNIVIDGYEMIGYLEGEKKLCYNNGWRAVTVFPHRAPTNERYQEGQNWGVIYKNLQLNQWTPWEECPFNRLIEVEVTLVATAGWNAYSLFENVTYDGSMPLITNGCNYETTFNASDTALEFSGDSTTLYGEYGGNGYLVGSLHLPFADSGNGCHAVDGCLYFCPGSCLRTIVFRTSSGSDVENYVMKVSDGSDKLITVDKWYNNKDINKVGLFYDRPLTYSVSLPAGSFDVWFEDENGNLVYPKYVTPYFEKEPTCSGYATEESITIQKPPGGGPRCDDLIHNGDFTIGLDGWQSFKGKFKVSETAGADGAAALYFEKDHGQLSQWLDMTCLEAGVYEFRAYFKVVDDVSNVDSAQDITKGWHYPQPMLKFMKWQENQRLKTLNTLKQDPISEDPVEKNKVGNGGALNGAQSLGRCEGDCDRDKDCMPGLVCFQQSNVPIPGCLGQSGTTEFCIDPYTHELSGFHLLLGSFTINSENAAADALRLVFANTKTGLIIDKISLRKAPWLQGDDTLVPTNAPSKKPTSSPTVSPATKAPSKKPTSSPTVSPTKTSSPTVSPTKPPAKSLTNSPTLVPSLLEQALAVMKYIVDTMQLAFESSITLPLLGSELNLLFNEFAIDVESYAEESFPEGISNLKNYDDDLPVSMPSFDEYISTVLSALEQQYVDANTAAIAAAVQVVKNDWNKRVEDALEVAVKVATAIKSNDIVNDDPLPYLDAAANEMLKSGLTEAVDNYGDRVLSCAAVDSMLV